MMAREEQAAKADLRILGKGLMYGDPKGECDFPWSESEKHETKPRLLLVWEGIVVPGHVTS